MALSRILSVIFCFIILGARAQGTSDFAPAKVHSDKSKTLIREIQRQRTEELNNIGFFDTRIFNAYERQSEELLKLIDQGFFLNDDSLQHFVKATFDTILEANQIDSSYKTLLIARSPQVNALSYGEGTFIVTTGLLGRIRNESQLAFTLAHELAHYELDHLKKSIRMNAQNKTQAKVVQGFGKVVSGDASQKNIEDLKKVVYSSTSFDRQNEFQADSLGSVFLRRAGFDYQKATSMLLLFDPEALEQRPTGVEMFKPFEFTKYPFQQSWLNERISIFSKRPENFFMFEYDSLESHPDILARVNRVDLLIPSLVENGVEEAVNHQPIEFIDRMILKAEFETVESAYFRKQFDWCLLAALKLLDRYPQNTYLISTIEKVFIKLYEASETNEFFLYVSPYTINYSEDLRLVNNFLYNLTIEDIGELAFNFINKKSSFNPEKQEHYFLLWQISDLTHRAEVQKRVRRAYEEKFGNGEYLKKMK